MATQCMVVTLVGGLACAFPIEHVIEIMRPPAVEPIGRSRDPALALIDGLAIVRGAPIPVIDARRLFGIPGGRATRAVVVRVADRQLAVLVDEVVGVRQIDQTQLCPLPSLLGGAHRDSVSAIGARDARLLVVLDSARVLPEDSWQAIDRRDGR